MKYYRYILSLAILFIFIAGHIQGKNLQKTICKISILTCGPGDEIYSLYGHSAIRVQCGKEDIVYNYGVFSFNQPNFLWLFTLGKADYTIGKIPFDMFFYDCYKDKRSLVEQEVNLSNEASWNIASKLEYISSLGNWTYKYNFLKDNCTTRAIAILKQTIVDDCNEKMVSPSNVPDSISSFRKIIHQYVNNHYPWITFGQDLLLGQASDTLIQASDLLSFPQNAEKILDNSYLVDNKENRKPLILSKRTLLSFEGNDNDKKNMSPTILCLIILITTFIVSYYDMRKMKIETISKTNHSVRTILVHVYDNFLMFLMGIIGLLLSFMFFFSMQPTVSTNYLILILNPLILICTAIKIFTKSRKVLHIISFFVIACILLGASLSFTYQTVPLGVFFLALSLLVRMVTLNCVSSIKNKHE